MKLPGGGTGTGSGTGSGAGTINKIYTELDHRQIILNWKKLYLEQHLVVPK